MVDGSFKHHLSARQKEARADDVDVSEQRGVIEQVRVNPDAVQIVEDGANIKCADTAFFGGLHTVNFYRPCVIYQSCCCLSQDVIFLGWQCGHPRITLQN